MCGRKPLPSLDYGLRPSLRLTDAFPVARIPPPATALALGVTIVPFADRHHALRRRNDLRQARRPVVEVRVIRVRFDQGRAYRLTAWLSIVRVLTSSSARFQSRVGRRMLLNLLAV